MAKLGDRGGILVWATYVRWPLFSVGGMILGLVLGIIFGGLLGMVMGAAVGIFAGFFIGLVMGKDQSAFPVIFEKWAAYGGGAPTYEGKHPARVVTLQFKDDMGNFVERRVVEYLQGTTVRQLPNYSLPVWFQSADPRDLVGRKLMALQIDTYTYRPILWEKGIFIATDVPVYERAQDGKPLRDAEGKPVQARRLVLDKDGKPMLNEDGTEKTEPATVRVEMFDSNVEWEDGKEVAISKGRAAKLDNERVNYTQAYRIAATFNRQGDWWAKHGHIIVAVLAIAAVLLIVIFALLKFGEVSSDWSSKTAGPLLEAAKANQRAAELNAQVAAALLKAGWNANVTFANAMVAAAQNAPPVNSGQGIDLPLLGHAGG